MNTNLTIATRESQLALWQANWVASCIQKTHPHITVRLLAMSTQADRAPYLSLQNAGGKGLFVKELEEAIVDGRADLAVHCMKDMPVDLPSGLCLAAMSAREAPWDALVSNQYPSLAQLPRGANVGTSSLRRSAQLLHLRPDIRIQPLRGNVVSRLARLDKGEYDAIILAAAGLKRLGFLSRLNNILTGEEFLPAAGQGVLGIECRQHDIATQKIVACVNNAESFICVSAERALCKQLGAQCFTPVAAYAEIKKNILWLRAMVATVDGKTILTAEASGILTEPEILGKKVGDDLLRQGAAAILAKC